MILVVSAYESRAQVKIINHFACKEPLDKTSERFASLALT